MRPMNRCICNVSRRRVQVYLPRRSLVRSTGAVRFSGFRMRRPAWRDDDDDPGGNDGMDESDHARR